MFVMFFGKVCVRGVGGGGKRQHCVCYRVEPPPAPFTPQNPAVS